MRAWPQCIRQLDVRVVAQPLPRLWPLPATDEAHGARSAALHASLAAALRLPCAVVITRTDVASRAQVAQAVCECRQLLEEQVWNTHVDL